MKVTVVYALPDRQIVRDLDLQSGATVTSALEQSGLLIKYPEIDAPSVPVGIYGRVVPRGTLLQPGDRVEIYRPLNEEPKEARRKRVRRN